MRDVCYPVRTRPDYVGFYMDAQDPENLAGLLSGLKKVVKKVGKVVKPLVKVAAPIAAGFIPGVGGLVATGIAQAGAARDAKKQAKLDQQALAKAQAQYVLPEGPGTGGPGFLAGLGPNGPLILGAAALGAVFLLSRRRNPPRRRRRARR